MGAVLIAIIEVAGVHVAAVRQAHTTRMDWLGYTLIIVGCVALMARFVARVPALAVTIASAAAFVLLGFPYGPVFLAPLVAVFGAVRAGKRAALWTTLVIAYVVFLSAGRIWPHAGPYTLRRPSLGSAVTFVVWTALMLVIAEIIRARSAHFAEVRRTMIEQARARDEWERRQASEERLRIAQELHDVVGHHLSLISVQAGIGLHLMDEHPDQARTALVTIKEASAEALGEVRAVLAALRPKDERAPRAPAPTLADLGGLIEPDRVAITGARRPLPPDVERAAYRIVQESLTNVRRHAGESAVATVTVTYGADRLTIRIADDGRGGAVGNGGTGIAGMRTRAAALGGTLVTTSPAEGGFVVTAVLPIPPAPAPAAPIPSASNPSSAEGSPEEAR